MAHVGYAGMNVVGLVVGLVVAAFVAAAGTVVVVEIESVAAPVVAAAVVVGSSIADLFHIQLPLVDPQVPSLALALLRRNSLSDCWRH